MKDGGTLGGVNSGGWEGDAPGGGILRGENGNRNGLQSGGGSRWGDRLSLLFALLFIPKNVKRGANTAF